MTRVQLPKPVKRSGTIWSKNSRVRLEIVAGVCGALRSAYGTPRLGNPKTPVSDLVYIIITNKTTPSTARETYQRLRMKYKKWEDMISSRPVALRSVLKPAGLSTVKSRQLMGALRKIKRDFGKCDLRALRGWKEDEIHTYLTSLLGVSDKVAKCVMMYTMGASVLPVDSHVHRIAARLGWTTRKRADQCHQELESLVPPELRYIFHVGGVLHGREVCHPVHPACSRCCISRYCEYIRALNGRN